MSSCVALRNACRLRFDFKYRLSSCGHLTSCFRASLSPLRGFFAVCPTCYAEPEDAVGAALRGRHELRAGLPVPATDVRLHVRSGRPRGEHMRRYCCTIQDMFLVLRSTVAVPRHLPCCTIAQLQAPKTEVNRVPPGNSAASAACTVYQRLPRLCASLPAVAPPDKSAPPDTAGRHRSRHNLRRWDLPFTGSVASAPSRRELHVPSWFAARVGAIVRSNFDVA